MKKESTIIFGILTNYFQYALNVFLGVFLSPLVLKYAGQETMGAYAILLQVISYVSLVDLGVGLTSSRFLSQSYAVGRDEFVATCNVFRSVGILQSALMAVLFFLLSFFSRDLFQFNELLAADVNTSLRILAVWTLISSPWSFYNAVLYSTNHLAQQNIIDSISNFVKIISAILFVTQGWSIIGLILSQIMSSLVGLILKFYYITKKVGRLKFQFSFALNDKFREILSFSLNGFLITIAMKLVFSTDYLIIGSLFGPLAVSIYYLTAQPGNILNQFVLKITDNFTPSLNIWYANADIEKLRNSFVFLFRITFFLTVLMVWGITFCSGPLISIWVGKENYLPQPMSLWCGLLSGTIVLAHVPNAFVIAVGKIRMLSYFALFEGVLNLFLSLLFGSAMGMHGVMLATLVANIPTCFYLFYKGTNLLKFQKEFIAEFVHWKYLVSFLIIPALWFLVKRILVIGNFYSSNNLLNTFVMVIIIYPIAICTMYHFLVSEEEREMIKIKFKKRLEHFKNNTLVRRT